MKSTNTLRGYWVFIVAMVALYIVFGFYLPEKQNRVLPGAKTAEAKDVPVQEAPTPEGAMAVAYE